VSFKLYVEGGGDRNKALQTECRRGFSEFLSKAGLKGRMPRIVACGGRTQTYDSFRTAHAEGGMDHPIFWSTVKAPSPKETRGSMLDGERETGGSDRKTLPTISCTSWFKRWRPGSTRTYNRSPNTSDPSFAQAHLAADEMSRRSPRRNFSPACERPPSTAKRDNTQRGRTRSKSSHEPTRLKYELPGRHMPRDS
jgi:hypothetical protein